VIVPQASLFGDEQENVRATSAKNSANALSIDLTMTTRAEGERKMKLSCRMDIDVRDATAEDYPVFANLFPALGVEDPAPSPEEFAAHMLPSVIFAREGGEPIGYACWQVQGPRAHVRHVVVSEGTRRRGAGRALMGEVRRRVLAAGCSRWFLNVIQSNAVAIRLYERCGLVIEQEGWAVRAEWSQLASLPEPSGAVTVYAPESDGDATLTARFDERPERLRMLRGREGIIIRAVREEGAPVAFAAFDPSFSGVYPVRVARVDFARPLFDHLRRYARESHVQVFVEGDRLLCDALTACGARIHMAMFRMGAGLP
jgi:ribosomal protein S18 acetylase RimI-like enzyme